MNLTPREKDKLLISMAAMVARLLGEATSVRAATVRFLGEFRGCRLPRVWHI